MAKYSQGARLMHQVKVSDYLTEIGYIYASMLKRARD